MKKRQTTQKTTPPCYLFNRLGRNIALSTASGDFFELEKKIWSALRSWNNNFAQRENAASRRKFKSIKNIIKRFPFPEHGTKEDKHPVSLTDITLNLTAQCNLACIYCWNDRGKYSHSVFYAEKSAGNNSLGNNCEMDFETAKAAINLLRKLSKGERHLVVDFYGGEPLMNLKTLRFVVDYCRKKELQWKVEFRFLIATNGTLLTAELARELIGKGVQIAISIDGKQEIQDHNRPCAGGRGSFEIIAENLRNMPEELLKKLVARATVTPHYSKMADLYRQLRGMGFERIELFESEEACHKITKQREKVFFHTQRQYRMLCREYLKLARLYIEEVNKGFLDYRKTFFNRFFKLMQRLYYNQEVTGGCPAGRGQIAVAGDGKIYPCTAFIGVSDFELGDVKNGFDNTKYKTFLAKADERFDNCKECPIFSICRATGSCLNLNHYYSGDMSVPYKRGCEFFKFKIELAMATLSILSEKMKGKLPRLFGNDPAGTRGNVY